MSERARLTDLIESVYCDATGMRLATSVAQRLAVEIASDGYRRIPTEGPEWWGAVDKALEAWWCHFDGPYLNVPGALSVENNPIRKGLSIAIRAALGIER